MKIDEYQKLARVTCNTLGDIKLDLSHMIMGMISEYNELVDANTNRDIVNIREESADVVWYIANYCTFRGYDLSDFFVLTRTEMADYELTYNISKLADLVKKFVAYGKPINEEEEKAIINEILTNILEFFNFGQADFLLALDRNIAKLKQRYGDKFSSEKAINRNTKAERAVLELDAE